MIFGVEMLSQMFSQNLSLLISNLNLVVLFIGSEPTSGSSQLIRFSQLTQPELLSRALAIPPSILDRAAHTDWAVRE